MITNFDIFGIIVILFFALRVLHRGFVNEVLTLGALFGGIIVAALFSGSAARVVSRVIEQRIWSQIVAFLLVFVVVYFSIKIIHRFIENGLEAINAVNLDRALGLCFGIIEGIAVIIAVILLLQVVPFVNENSILADSIMVRVIAPLIPTVLSVLRV